MKWPVIALLICVAVGVVGAFDARVFVVASALCVVAWLCVLAYRFPAPLIGIGIFIVLVAGTKFRSRDSSASLADVIDAMVIFELGLYGVVALVVTMAMFSRSFRMPRLSVMESLLLAFVVLAACSALWSSAPRLTLVRASQAAILLALGLVATRILGTSGTLRALGNAVVVYVLLCSALAAVFPWAREGTIDNDGIQRFSWFAMHSIIASTLTGLAILYLVCIALFAPGGWKRRWGAIPLVLCLIPLAAVMIAANSRGPLFALVGSIGSMLAFRYLRPSTALVIAASGSMLILVSTVRGVTAESVAAAGAESNSVIVAHVLRGQTLQEFGSLTGRTDMWARIMPLYFERPFTGYGYQAARAVLLPIVPWAGHAHNALIQTLLDLGTVGALLLWIPFLRAVFVRPQRRSREAWVPAWQSATVFALTIFMLLNSVTDAAFVGTPGIELLLVFCCVMLASRIVSVNARPAGDSTPDVIAPWSAGSTQPAR